MINNEFENDALIALIEGVLSQDDALALKARIAADPALAREYAACVELYDAFGTLADCDTVDTPEIDILAAVTSGVDAIKSGARPAPRDGVPYDPAVVAFFEGEDSTFEMTDEERDALQGIWNDLDALGDAYNLDAPTIDITESALERLGEEEARVADDLHALGDIAHRTLQPIDIVSDVMAAVATAKDRPENVVPFRTRPKPEQHQRKTASPMLPWGRALAAAAAAVLIFALGFASRDLVGTVEQQATNTESSSDPIQVPGTATGQDGFGRVEATDTTEDASTGEWITPNAPDTPAAPEESDPAKKPGFVFAKRPGMSDIFNARRAAMMGDEQALASLADWAALSPEEALRILEQAGYSPETVLGAIPFLSSDDAIGLLKGAVGQDPSNPQLRAALAENLIDAGRFDESYAELAQWSAADPTNGLPAYYEAQSLFAQGDIAAGLAALENASAYDGVDTYSRERARDHENVLRAAGMDPESATALAGLAANDGAYSDMTALGQDFLNQGHALAAQGDYAGAISAYRAALELGQRVQAQTAFMNEAQVAVQIQQEAIEALNQISTQTALSEEMLGFLSQTNQDVVNSVAAIGEIYEALFRLFESGSTEEILALLQGLMNGNGALSYVF